MRIGLIAFSGVRVRNPELAALGVTLPGFVRRGRVIASLPSLGLLTVAGLTPPEHEVAYLEIDDLRDDTELPDFDLVGLSALSAQIDQAYAVADIYRGRGTRVVMGGLHVSAMPDETLAHADSVVVGGAEGAWERVVQDADNGRLAGIYRGRIDGVFEGATSVMPRFDLLSGRPYNRFTVQTSRGCPRDCEFCGASLRISPRFQQKPAARVLEEIRAARIHVRHPFLEFADDNTFLNRAWSRELLDGLAREEIRWFAETDASVADDPDLCDRLARAGCRQVLIGFESPRGDDLAGLDPVDWKRRQAPRLRQTVDVLQSRGVSVNGCFILGLDHHGTDIFPEVLEAVRSAGLAEVQFTVLTPFPGTPLRQRLAREGRLLADRYWDRCTLFDVVYQPARMTVAELESGLRWLFSEAYNPLETQRRQRAFARGSRT